MKRVLSLLLVLALAVCAAPAASAANEYGVGEVWTVDDMFSLEILGVTEVEERNEFSDKDPAAVYVVDYVYANLGYEEENWDGLYINIDNQIVDAAGEMGYSYPGDVEYYARETPLGAICYAQCCIGVDNAGDFKLYVSEYDSSGTRHKATFKVDTDAEPVDFASIDRDEPMEPYDGAYRIGETWTVDGQWSLTITGITETEERNEYTGSEPGAVYIIDYAYTNLGYENDIWDGLYMNIDDCVVDSVGFMGWTYPGDISGYARETPEGATCRAQACVGVWHAGDLQLVVTHYDGNDKRQSAVFYVQTDPEAPAKPAKSKDKPAEDVGEIRADVKEFLDGYEAVVNEYVDFMEKYMKADAGEVVSMLGDLTKLLDKYAGYVKELEKLDTSKFNKAEMEYYNEIVERAADRVKELIENE